MKTASRILPLLTCSVVIASGAAGCVTDEVSIGGDGGDLGTWEEPVDVLEGYPFCSDNFFAGPAMCPRNLGDPPDGMMLLTEVGNDCYCPRACLSEANCPTPTTGTSAPVCAVIERDFNMCVLPCGDGQTCPDGMTCSSAIENDTGAICVWHDDDVIRTTPRVCGDRTTQEECEAYPSHYPAEPDYRCVWVKETLVERDDLSCAKPHTSERCVAVQRDDSGSCDGGVNCAGAPGALYWVELGAGDISLVEVDVCDERPYTVTGPYYHACDFSGTNVSPSVCNCACGAP